MIDYQEVSRLVYERSRLLSQALSVPIEHDYQTDEDYADAKRAEAEQVHETLIKLWVSGLEDRRPPVAQELQVNGQRFLLQSNNGREARYVTLTKYRPGPYRVQELSFEAHIRQQIRPTEQVK